MLTAHAEVPASAYTCGADPSTAIEIPGDQQVLGDLVGSDVTANGGAMWCAPNGDSWFLLNALGGVCEGGNKNNLDGIKWGGITLQTVTQSAYTGYQANGKNTNMLSKHLRYIY